MLLLTYLLTYYLLTMNKGQVCHMVCLFTPPSFKLYCIMKEVREMMCPESPNRHATELHLMNL